MQSFRWIFGGDEHPARGHDRGIAGRRLGHSGVVSCLR